MKNKGTVELETKRLILRKFEIEDAEAMFKNWARDKEVTKFLTWINHSSVDVTEIVLKDWISHYDEKGHYQWAIVLKDINEPIGSISVVDQDSHLEMVQIGFAIGRNWWNKGLVTEALEKIIDFFFNEVGVNRIESIHDIKNIASGKVMKKSGLKYEGTSKDRIINEQGISDAMIYGLVRKDYEK